MMDTQAHMSAASQQHGVPSLPRSPCVMAAGKKEGGSQKESHMPQLPLTWVCLHIIVCSEDYNVCVMLKSVETSCDLTVSGWQEYVE